jgi:ABC-2 type transport system permease protein
VKSGFGRQFWLLSKRSVARTFRDPGNLGPAVAVPLLLFAVIASGLSDVTNIEGFPTDSFVTFALTIPFAQGALMVITNTGQAIATDIEHGFINRLALTPLRRIALLLAQLTGAIAVGLVQAGIFLGVGLAAGARFEAGITGAVVLVVMFLGAVIGFGAFGVFLALWTGSGQAVQAIAPLTAVFLFLSSMAFPRNLIETDWFRKVATVNPISYYVEGLRSLLITGWDKQALVLGFAFVVGVIVLSLAGALYTMERRLATR